MEGLCDLSPEDSCSIPSQLLTRSLIKPRKALSAPVKDSHRSGTGTCLAPARYKMHHLWAEPFLEVAVGTTQADTLGAPVCGCFSHTEGGTSGLQMKQQKIGRPNPRERGRQWRLHSLLRSRALDCHPSWPPLWSLSHLFPTCLGHLCVIRVNTCGTGACTRGTHGRLTL